MYFILPLHFDRRFLDRSYKEIFLLEQFSWTGKISGKECETKRKCQLFARRWRGIVFSQVMSPQRFWFPWIKLRIGWVNWGMLWWSRDCWGDTFFSEFSRLTKHNTGNFTQRVQNIFKRAEPYQQSFSGEDQQPFA